MVRRIVNHKNRRLRQPSNVIIEDNLDKLCQDMYDTCKTLRGIGLAAPQIGINKRIILIAPPGKIPTFMVNPIISDKEGEFESQEGCLSAKGKFGKVKRFSQITVDWSDLQGNHQKAIALDFEAAIIQHEVDHLDGILCIDKFF